MPTLAAIVDRIFAHQDFLFWEKVGSDPFGKPVYKDQRNPVALKARWEQKQQEILTMDGRKVLSRGYLLLTTFLPAGSLVFLGTLADWQALPGYPNVPTVNQGGSEVIITKTTPDVPNKSKIYETYL